MKIEGSVALVTGSNRGIGLGFVKVLLECGASKVYATAREAASLPEVVDLDPSRITGFVLDIDDEGQRRSVAKQTADTSLLINNAGIPGSENEDERRFLRASSLEDARQVMETDCFSPIEMCRLYLPDMVKRGEGGVINILSIGAIFCLPSHASYCAAKGAQAIMTMGLRADLDGTGVDIAGVYTGGVRTRMSARDIPTLLTPEEHARDVFDAFEAGERHIFAGLGAGEMRDTILADPGAFEQRQIERFRNPEKAWD
ncbi:MAG: SDR family NAD(P)-dependent oxidoreductase [Gammaproteobacteria bacterium]|nr:SDR family NAD(P)-dependent oxidoreductase [Gammaproteobacteria bacterium]